jgi:hypothetical protein
VLICIALWLQEPRIWPEASRTVRCTSNVAILILIYCIKFLQTLGSHDVPLLLSVKPTLWPRLNRTILSRHCRFQNLIFYSYSFGTSLGWYIHQQWIFFILLVHGTVWQPLVTKNLRVRSKMQTPPVKTIFCSDFQYLRIIYLQSD